MVTNYYANSDAAAAALTSGQLDQIGGLTPAQYNAMSEQAGLMTYQTQSSGWTAVEINSGAQDPQRQADRHGQPDPQGHPRSGRRSRSASTGTSWSRRCSTATAIVGAGYLPPGYPQFFWKPSASEALDYDPARAKQLLDQAGYKMGPNGVRVDARRQAARSSGLGIHSDDATDAAIAPYLQEWMTAIGIKLDVNSMSFDQLNNNLAKGDWDMLMDGWSTGPDPTYLLSIQTCGTLPADNGTNGNTDAFFCNKQYDKLYEKQQTQFDPRASARRRSTTMQKILYANNADLILFYKNGLVAMRTDQMTDYLQGSKDSAGFYPLQHGFTSWYKAKPAAGATTANEQASEQSSNALKWIGLAVVVVARDRWRSCSSCGVVRRAERE